MANSLNRDKKKEEVFIDRDPYNFWQRGWDAGRKDLLEWFEQWFKSDLHGSLDSFIAMEMENIKKQTQNDQGKQRY